MLEFKTNFFPYSMSLSRKEPVSLSFQVQNKSEETATATFRLYTGYQLGLDEKGLKNNAEFKIEKLEPNQKKQWQFTLYPKITTQIGENPVQIQVQEHFADDFSLIKRKYNLNLTLLARK